MDTQAKVKNYQRWMGLALVWVTLTAVGCATPRGSTAAEKRNFVENKRATTVNEFREKRADGTELLTYSPGYAVFSNIGTQLFWAGTNLGYGVVVDNRTGQHTYMKMGGLKGGIGLGVTAFRAVFIFHDPAVLENFVNEGFTFDAKAEATASLSDNGNSVDRETAIGNGLSVYQFNDNGLSVGVTVSGAKFWRDAELNARNDQLVQPTVRPDSPQRRGSSRY